jgi:N-acetylglucosaminyldiphosphoundecaprenol N-acetyl-beta-D-mannosaminyltransferase
MPHEGTTSARAGDYTGGRRSDDRSRQGPQGGRNVARGTARVARISLLSIDFDDVDQDAFLDRVFDAVDQGVGGWVITPNVDILRMAEQEPRLAALYRQASMSIADGAPLVWAARLSGTPVPERLPGASMFWVLAEEAAIRGRSVLLLGGRPGAAELAAERLRELYPDLQVSHYCPPMGFERNPAEFEAVVRVLRSQGPDLVFLGLSTPKQDRVAQDLREAWPTAWYFGFGAAIDIAAGLLPRAPQWMQAAGLEWLFRLMMEPRRLSGRYLVRDLPFAMHLFRWALESRVRRTRAVRRRARQRVR